MQKINIETASMEEKWARLDFQLNHSFKQDERILWSVMKLKFHQKREDDSILIIPCSKEEETFCNNIVSCGSWFLLQISKIEKPSAMDIAGALRYWNEDWKEFASSNVVDAAIRALNYVEKANKKKKNKDNGSRSKT